jgi:hypothetical protein
MQEGFTGQQARQLLRAQRTAALSTLDAQGAPYGSLVNYATTLEGAPIVFISGLAWHTRNLERDRRGCLLVTDDGAAPGDALAGARVSVMGQFVPISRDKAAGRYLARHPEADFYIKFQDFSFWALAVETVHAVAGFGRIQTLGTEQVLLSSPQVTEFVEQIGSLADIPDAVAADPDGVDFVTEGRAGRINFAQPAFRAKAWREALAAKKLSPSSALP